MKKPKVPCGRTLGFGEYCVKGHLCQGCSEIERLEGLLAKTWDIARDNHLDFRDRIDKIMKTVREKPDELPKRS